MIIHWLGIRTEINPDLPNAEDVAKSLQTYLNKRKPRWYRFLTNDYVFYVYLVVLMAAWMLAVFEVPYALSVGAGLLAFAVSTFGLFVWQQRRWYVVVPRFGVTERPFSEKHALLLNGIVTLIISLIVALIAG